MRNKFRIAAFGEFLGLEAFGRTGSRATRHMKSACNDPAYVATAAIDTQLESNGKQCLSERPSSLGKGNKFEKESRTVFMLCLWKI